MTKHERRLITLRIRAERREARFRKPMSRTEPKKLTRAQVTGERWRICVVYGGSRLSAHLQLRYGQSVGMRDWLMEQVLKFKSHIPPMAPTGSYICSVQWHIR